MSEQQTPADTAAELQTTQDLEHLSTPEIERYKKLAQAAMTKVEKAGSALELADHENAFSTDLRNIATIGGERVSVHDAYESIPTHSGRPLVLLRDDLKPHQWVAAETATGEPAIARTPREHLREWRVGQAMAAQLSPEKKSHKVNKVLGDQGEQERRYAKKQQKAIGNIQQAWYEREALLSKIEQIKDAPSERRPERTTHIGDGHWLAIDTLASMDPSDAPSSKTSYQQHVKEIKQALKTAFRDNGYDEREIDSLFDTLRKGKYIRASGEVNMPNIRAAKLRYEQLNDAGSQQSGELGQGVGDKAIMAEYIRGEFDGEQWTAEIAELSASFNAAIDDEAGLTGRQRLERKALSTEIATAEIIRSKLVEYFGVDSDIPSGLEAALTSRIRRIYAKPPRRRSPRTEHSSADQDHAVEDPVEFARNYLAGATRAGTDKDKPFTRMHRDSLVGAFDRHGIGSAAVANRVYDMLVSEGVIDEHNNVISYRTS